MTGNGFRLAVQRYSAVSNAENDASCGKRCRNYRITNKVASHNVVMDETAVGGAIQSRVLASLLSACGTMR